MRFGCRKDEGACDTSDGRFKDSVLLRSIDLVPIWTIGSSSSDSSILRLPTLADTLSSNPWPGGAGPGSDKVPIRFPDVVMGDDCVTEARGTRLPLRVPVLVLLTEASEKAGRGG